MIQAQIFIKCVHELPHYNGLFWVRLKDGCKTIASYNTHSKSFDVRGVVEWSDIQND